MSEPFTAWASAAAARVDKLLLHYLQELHTPAPKLQAAMAHTALNGGKRIRPLLVYATGEIFSAPEASLDVAATAIELIHSYSLIHDDLPAMDNADLRRGKASCHQAFGEDLAILAGDAMQALAFELIASHPAPLNSEQRLRMVQVLSHASGPSGMVGGQTLDILNQAPIDKITLLQLYNLKTGALLTAAVQLGFIATSPYLTSAVDAAHLERFAQKLSLAFQIQDDLLDIEKTSAELGKTAGIDQRLAKNTYPVLMGVDAAKEEVASLFAAAFAALETFGDKAEGLRHLAQAIQHREN